MYGRSPVHKKSMVEDAPKKMALFLSTSTSFLPLSNIIKNTLNKITPILG